MGLRTSFLRRWDLDWIFTFVLCFDGLDVAETVTGALEGPTMTDSVIMRAFRANAGFGFEVSTTEVFLVLEEFCIDFKDFLVGFPLDSEPAGLVLMDALERESKK